MKIIEIYLHTDLSNEYTELPLRVSRKNQHVRDGEWATLVQWESADNSLCRSKQVVLFTMGRDFLAFILDLFLEWNILWIEICTKSVKTRMQTICRAKIGIIHTYIWKMLNRSSKICLLLIPKYALKEPKNAKKLKYALSIPN